jgi:mRNA interferase RelE/StbE
MYEVVLSSKAKRFFEDAPASIQRKLDRCFDTLKVDPRHHSNIKPLSGPLTGYYRFRAGDYRVVYRIDDERRMVSVERIAHRREAYQ